MSDGTVIENVEPKNGSDFSLEELQEIVGGCVEFAHMGKETMALNEEGKLLGLPMNEKATSLYHEHVYKGDYIVGDVLVCDANQIV